MPKLKEIDINFDQILELVCQLEFKKKMSLIQEIIKEREYKSNFYAYTESLLTKYNIPRMNEDELDDYLHQRVGLRYETQQQMKYALPQSPL